VGTKRTARRIALLAAAASGVPVMIATSDCRVVQALPIANAPCAQTTPGPDTATWDDSPFVTDHRGHPGPGHIVKRPSRRRPQRS
jgi:hypothetical protein